MSHSVVLMGKSTWVALTRFFIEERAVEHDAEENAPKKFQKKGHGMMCEFSTMPPVAWVED